MFFLKKNRFKPSYKKLTNIRENIKNGQKILKFKKKKWRPLISIITKELKAYNKYPSQNQLQYVAPNIVNKWNSYKKNRHRSIIQTFKKFKLFYGYYNKKKIKTIIGKTIKKSNKTDNINLDFLNLFESRLDVVLYRAKFCESIRIARQLISHNGVYINEKKVNSQSYILKNGDLLKISNKYNKFIQKNLANAQIWPIPPKHLAINYRTLQLIFCQIGTNNPSIYFNFNLNLEKILIDYKRY